MKKLFHVVDKAELTNAQGDPNAALALAANLGISFGATATGDLLTAAKGGTHGYMPTDFKEIQTGFCDIWPWYKIWRGVATDRAGGCSTANYKLIEPQFKNRWSFVSRDFSSS